MSEEGFKNSLVPQLKVMKANGCETAVLVPGRIGQDLAEQVLGIHKNQMAETSNFYWLYAGKGSTNWLQAYSDHRSYW